MSTEKFSSPSPEKPSAPITAPANTAAGGPPAPPYENAKGCLGLLALAAVCIVVSLVFILLFADFQ